MEQCLYYVYLSFHLQLIIILLHNKKKINIQTFFIAYNFFYLCKCYTIKDVSLKGRVSRIDSAENPPHVEERNMTIWEFIALSSAPLLAVFILYAARITTQSLRSASALIRDRPSAITRPFFRITLRCATRTRECITRRIKWDNEGAEGAGRTSRPISRKSSR